MADELAYQLTLPLREGMGADDPNMAAALNKLAVLDNAEKQQILQQAEEATRLVLQPLAYKLLEMNGLDPDTADPQAARAVLTRNLTPHEEAVLQDEYNKAIQQVGAACSPCMRT